LPEIGYVLIKKFYRSAQLTFEKLIKWASQMPAVNSRAYHGN